MIFKNKKIQKIISVVMILAVLSPATAIFISPRQVEAQVVTHDPITSFFTHLGAIFGGKTSVESTVSTGVLLKNLAKDILKQVLTVIAKKALASMTKSTVNWINNGFHGAPLFIQNPQSFFKDITTSQIKDLISIVGYDPNRFPFGKQQALNIIAGYKSQLNTNAAYSLSTVTNDPTLLYNFRTNFSVGGWNGFILNTQYPQNNFIGSQMQINNQLAQQLQGIVQAPAQKINTLLQQGQGFLSPQKCVGPNADAYNASLTNEFQKPTWQTPASIEKDYPDPKNYTNFDDPAYVAALQKYNDEVIAAKADWAKTNVCQGSLQNTTPGSVVASQVTRALGESFSTTEIGIAVGNSLSAVFDSLLNKFLGSGLNSLASTVNTSAPIDNFSYNGQTLGSPSSNTNGSQDVFNGPDQEIILSKFKDQLNGITDANGKYTPGDIANTQLEIKLMDNSDPNNYGISQMLSLIWPKARELDICTPGPDLGWEARLKDDADRNGQKLQEKSGDNDGAKAYAASLTLKELQYAEDFFRDWIQTAMIKSGSNDLGLPDSTLFLDAVKDVTNLSDESTQLVDKKRLKTTALARLQAISSALNNFTTQPIAGSQGEKDLVTLRNQYDAISDSISNSFTLNDTQSELDTLKEKYNNYGKLINQCTQERIQKGWSVPPGGWDTPVGSTSILASAKGKPFAFTIAGPPDGKPFTIRAVTSGTEQEQFCFLPSFGGYTHETFKQPLNPVPYPDIPLLNGVDVFNWKSGLFNQNTNRIAIQVDCNNVFNANLLDYKGQIAGPTNLVQPPNPGDTGGTGNPVIPYNTGTGTNTSGDVLGTCTGSNGSTETNVTQAACLSPTDPLLSIGSTSNTWTANSSSTNPGTVNPPPACGGAGQPACG